MKTRALLGKKIGMTQIFVDGGVVVPVSVVQAGPCVVLEKKSATGKDGYSAVKLGFGPAREKTFVKPALGYFKKLGVSAMKFVKEIRIPEDQLGDYEVGGELGASVFEPGDIVNVTGKSKGRGFAGVMKRYGFAGHRATHGTHESKRGPGAVGCSAWPGRIWKGKKMPGQYGNVPVTTENLEIVQVDTEKNLLLIKGAVPGHRNSVLLLKCSPKKWKRS